MPTAILEVRLDEFYGVPDQILQAVVSAVQDYRINNRPLKAIGGYTITVRVEGDDDEQD